MRVPDCLLMGFLLAATMCANDSIERGRRMETDRRWSEAASAYTTALKDATDNRVWLMTTIAEMHFNNGDYGRARHWLRQAEEKLQSTPHHDPATEARMLNARAALHLVAGRLREAESDLRSAVAAGERSGGKLQLAAAWHNLASVEMQTGRLREAEEHQRVALATWTDEVGSGHESVMRAWIGLSSIQGLRRDWQSAEISLREALRIAETAEAYSNLAVVLDNLKRGREAREIRKRFPALPADHGTISVHALGYRDGAMRPVAR